MNYIEQVFSYRESTVRVIQIANQPWFIANDICEILSLCNSRKALSRLDGDEKGVTISDTLGGKQEMSIINEAGLYSLILTSRKPEAKAFKRWITHEVLPSIRAQGSYHLPQQNFQLPLTYKQALIALVSEIEKNEHLQSLNEEQQHLLSEQQPKVELYDTFMDSSNCLNMSQVAKSFEWGRNRLYAFLRDQGILIDSKSIHMRNLPHQQYITQNYFKLIQVPVREGDSAIMKNQTLVTPKGVEFIGKLIKKDKLEKQFAYGYAQMEKEGIYDDFKC